jgi:hypothetical protein
MRFVFVPLVVFFAGCANAPQVDLGSAQRIAVIAINHELQSQSEKYGLPTPRLVMRTNCTGLFVVPWLPDKVERQGLTYGQSQTELMFKNQILAVEFVKGYRQFINETASMNWTPHFRVHLVGKATTETFTARPGDEAAKVQINDTDLVTFDSSGETSEEERMLMSSAFLKLAQLCSGEK